MDRCQSVPFRGPSGRGSVQCHASNRYKNVTCPHAVEDMQLAAPNSPEFFECMQAQRATADGTDVVDEESGATDMGQFPHEAL